MTDFKSVVQQIHRQQYATTYLLDGEEPYYIDLLLNEFEEKIIPEDQRDFNLIIFYGKDTSWKEVVNATRRFPMFGDKLVVILKEASQMKDLNELAAYVAEPMPSTVLVIEHRFKKLDNRGKLKKAVDAKGVHFHSEKIKENQVTPWIMDYCSANQVTIAHKDAEMITAYLGNDLQKIANEINKILINETSSREINSALIEKYIGISREYNVFEFPDILLGGNTEKISRILNYFDANPNAAPMPLVLTAFYTYVKAVYLSYYSKENFQADRKLGIWSKHRQAARSLSKYQVDCLIAILEEFSHKAMGFDNLNRDRVLLKEMTGKIMISIGRT